MKKKLLMGMILFLLAPLPFVSIAQETSPPPKTTPSPEPVPTPPQEFPAKKPRYDYMSSFFSRNTRPLGLKEDLALKKLLSQKGIKWAIRAESGHILN